MAITTYTRTCTICNDKKEVASRRDALSTMCLSCSQTRRSNSVTYDMQVIRDEIRYVRYCQLCDEEITTKNKSTRICRLCSLAKNKLNSSNVKKSKGLLIRSDGTIRKKGVKAPLGDSYL